MTRYPRTRGRPSARPRPGRRRRADQPDEALELYTRAPLHALGRAADAVRRRRYPDGIATYLIDRNINYTNVCVTACKFCAFYRPPKHAEGWTHAIDEILRRCGEAVELGAHPDHAAGRAPPGLRRRVLRGARSPRSRRTYPQLAHPLARRAPRSCTWPGSPGVDFEEAIARIHAAGLDSFAGAGAEILLGRARARRSPRSRSPGERWLEVMETAHGLGVESTATMHDGHRRDQRRAHRAPADDPRRAGPDGRLPRLHPVDLPAGEQPPQGPHPGDDLWSTCG